MADKILRLKGENTFFKKNLMNSFWQILEYLCYLFYYRVLDLRQITSAWLHNIGFQSWLKSSILHCQVTSVSNNVHRVSSVRNGIIDDEQGEGTWYTGCLILNLSKYSLNMRPCDKAIRGIYVIVLFQDGLKNQFSDEKCGINDGHAWCRKSQKSSDYVEYR